MAGGQYNDHVQFDMGDLVYDPTVRGLDVFLGVVLALCTLVGVPGNLVALKYFTIGVLKKKKKLHVTTFIYIAIASIDVCSGILHLPVMVVLFTARNPGIFNNLVFCVFWANVFESLQRVSIFLAMLLSVTRTIPIAFLRYQIRQCWVLSASLLYSFVILIEPLLGMLDKINYSYLYNGNNPNCFQLAALGLPFYVQYLLEATNILLVSLVTFFSFIVTLVKLCSIPNSGSRSKQRFRQASITVAIFTAIFLICNLPMFGMVIVYLVNEILYGYPGIFSQFFMNYYSWLVAKIVCVVLNASLNPVLYFLRMKDFNSWVRKGGKKQSVSSDPSSVGAS